MVIKLISCSILLLVFSFGDAQERRNLMMKPKGTIKTIVSIEDGDIIDCVDYYQQPAFDNPMSKNSQVKKDPTTSKELNDEPYSQVKKDPTTSKELNKQPYSRVHPSYISIRSNNSEIKLVGQTWHKYGSCPDGTVPIRRGRPVNMSMLQHTKQALFTEELGANINLRNPHNDRSY